jgi:hypothetical protein
MNIDQTNLGLHYCSHDIQAVFCLAAHLRGLQLSLRALVHRHLLGFILKHMHILVWGVHHKPTHLPTQLPGRQAAADGERGTYPFIK